ncbi:MAG: hypothetical protein ACQESG_01575 [Nanobdellota archaeon]
MAPNTDTEFVKNLLKDRSLLPKLKKHLLSLPKEQLVDMLLDMAPEEELGIPLSIFQSRLSVLQALVLYLRDHRDYKNKDIAEMLDRSSQVIWSTYNNARKQGVTLDIEPEPSVPLQACIRKNRTVLEGIVSYLREERGMRYSEIAPLLNRNERTIWTVYRRAQQK